MQRGSTGTYSITAAAGETVRAFVPHPLPPDPPVDITPKRQRLLERALLACGRLAAAVGRLGSEMARRVCLPAEDADAVSPALTLEGGR